ncbi:MAG: hypothetical protein WCJ73_10550, partial [Actinomycetes bacterium]
MGTPNTSYCHLRAGRIVVVGQNGTCTVIATASGTDRFAQGAASVTFTINNYTDPNPPPPPRAPAPASSTPPVFYSCRSGGSNPQSVSASSSPSLVSSSLNCS